MPVSGNPQWPTLAKQIRLRAVRMVTSANAAHIGSAMSIVDILTVLYFGVLEHSDQPEHPDRDRFILSKGHAVVGLYSTLRERGVITQEMIDGYGTASSPLMAHASHHVPGVELSTGALGHGLPVGVGKALAAKMRGQSWRTFVVLSDGELNEGSNWEALMFAVHHKLSNLTAIIDANGLQSLGTTVDTLNMEPLADRFRAFGCQVHEIDGHDYQQIAAAVTAPREGPVVVIARTVKGKGVSYMENQVAWHYKTPTADELAIAARELAVGAEA